MKKGQKGIGLVQEVVFPNKGIVMTEEGERVIVKNTIPGQKVSFAVNKARKGRYEGRLLEVLEKSALEIDPPCIHFGVCGGCTYQNLPYETQLELKEAQVRQLLQEAVGTACEYEFQGIKPSPRQFAYRNKMEFSFGDEYKDGPLALGMHRRGGFYDLVTVSECQIVDEDFRSILKATLEFFAEQKICYYHRLRHAGYLRHLLVRKALKTGEILVDLVTTTQALRWGVDCAKEQEARTGDGSVREQGVQSGAGSVREQGVQSGTGSVREQMRQGNVSSTEEEVLLKGWRERLCSLELNGTLKGVLHTKNDSVADVVKNEGTEILFGEDFFYEELLGLRFRISPFSFFQTNSLGAEVLYSTAREFILNGDEEVLREKTVYDLYSGTGTIAQMMAPVCKDVVGVEIVEEAVEAARENARLNGLSNCKFLAGDVLKVLDSIEEKPDFIILDPPRDGIHPKALEKIIDYGVENLVYISCKPTSLARDLEVFLARGYVVERVCCVDMFPGTGHVESIVLLSKLHTKQNIEVELEMSELDLTAAESKATYEEIKDYILKHTGLKVSSLYIAQIKQKCGIIERVNYNLPKSENSRQPKCPPEKEMVIREALEHFRMI